ncbi:hypothetical protein IWZ01DRAFT_320442 [Phyllosticta capitalensis]
MPLPIFGSSIGLDRSKQNVVTNIQMCSRKDRTTKMCQEQNKADVAKYLPKYFWNFCRALSMICIAKRVIFRLGRHNMKCRQTRSMHAAWRSQSFLLLPPESFTFCATYFPKGRFDYSNLTAPGRQVRKSRRTTTSFYDESTFLGPEHENHFSLHGMQHHVDRCSRGKRLPTGHSDRPQHRLRTRVRLSLDCCSADGCAVVVYGWQPLEHSRMYHDSGLTR